MTCEENSRKSGGPHDSMLLFDNDLIKCCPMCAVPIEKDEGCAQMMCKRCKHVFCWYCLASLDVSCRCLCLASLLDRTLLLTRAAAWLCSLFRMISCCVTTTKVRVRTSWVTRGLRSFGIERKSSESLQALAFCYSSLRPFYYSVSYAIKSLE